MTHHVYPTPAMVGDYARAAAGLCPTIAIFTMMPVGPVGAAVLGGFAALFAAFGIRTVLRHLSWLELSDGMLRSSGLRRTSISLCELDSVKLAYYSTRRDGRGGWMQLELRSGSSTIRLDSRLEGFAELVEGSAKAAKARGLFLNAATLANLQALGVKFGPAEAHFEPEAGEAA